ncbi:DUF5710 domain-containing protein (plasmid) [Methylocaldum sp. MU1018]|nr:DNA primase [Salmonella enterica]EIQ2412502.1 DNA primase [Salmonella enterica]
MRIDLQVPFDEKDEAKRCGARWDTASKVWYIPDGVDPKSFQRWLPKSLEHRSNIKSDNYFVAVSSKACWKCGGITKVCGIALPAGHETLEPVDEEDAGFGQNDVYTEAQFQEWLDSPASSHWVTSDFPTIVYYVSALPERVINYMQVYSHHYKLDFSKTMQTSYWMNHCEHCGMKQGDFEMYEEPDGTFYPLDAAAAAQITLHFINEPFSCSGTCSYGVDMFAYMKRA